MLTKKEIAAIIIVTIVLGFTLILGKTEENQSSKEILKIFGYTLLTIFLIIAINILAKKVASYYLDSEIEMKLWKIKQYGFKPQKHFKKAFPAGAFLPIITTALSAGYLVWLACLTFEVKPKIYRAAKRHGFYSFTEMTESHIGLIAVAGIVANLSFAIIGYLIQQPEFAKLNIYFAVITY